MVNRTTGLLIYEYSQSERLIRIIELLFRLILVIFALIGLIWRDFLLTFQGTLLYHSLMTLVIACMPDAISRLSKVSLTVELRAAFLIFIFLAQFLGEIFDFFNRIFWWDNMLHLVSAFFITLIGYAVVSINSKIVRQQQQNGWLAFASVFAISFSIAIATVWEIFEYAMDTIWGFNMQKSGLVDTMEDLIFCVVGSFIACFVFIYSLRKNRPSIFIQVVERLSEANQAEY